MRGALRTWLTDRRGLALSLVALLLQVLVPAGYMVADGQQGPAIVVCTGHGPLLAAGDLGHPGKAPASRPDAPCAFAGHGALAPPTVTATLAPSPVSYAPALNAIFADLAPGRGLAAPPPPALGPPAAI
ncbi:hypothetical protein [Phenylobacterium montanum]|uniref:DUF2946 domain-containing protein n=1 Tax=Phenylobacterium montanum TaxID=2823693 RepID=A0A975G1K1_9CAUL|nr:hypothetical protein [Caulobacter sp. S6]QUD88868.1 hypothetical protein KCG34_02980 [Caulobacter sp. S6]